MKIKSILVIGIMLACTNLFGARVEKEKITISNDFVVVSNATFQGNVTIGNETRSNWPTGITSIEQSSIAEQTNANVMTKEPSGWKGDTDNIGTLAFNPTTRVLSITNSVAMSAYRDGKLLTNSTSVSFPAIGTNRGIWYVKWSGSDGSQSVSQVGWALSDIQVATIDWSGGTNGTALVFEETHGFMPWVTHQRFHLDPKLSSAYVGGMTTTVNGKYFTMASGTWMDEDIYHSESQTTNCIVAYRDGTTGYMNFTSTRPYWYMTNAATGSLQWDNNGVLTDVSSGGGTANYMSMWCYVMPCEQSHVLWVAGRTCGSLTSVQAESPPDISSMTPSTETILMYRVILRRDTAQYIEMTDYRMSAIKGSAAATQLHVTLSGRADADQHPISAITGLEAFTNEVGTNAPKLNANNAYSDGTTQTVFAVKLGGETRTNWTVASGEAGQQMLSTTGTNTIAFAEAYSAVPHVVIQTMTGSTHQITYDVIAETTAGATFIARNASGLETNSGVKVTWATAGALGTLADRSGEVGRLMLSSTGTNTVSYAAQYNTIPKLFVQTYTGSTYQITYQTIANTSTGATFIARNSGGLETNTGVAVDWATAGALAASNYVNWATFPAGSGVDLNGNTMSNGSASVTALQVTGAGGIDMKGGPITNVDYVTTTNITSKICQYDAKTTNRMQVTISGVGFRPKGCTTFCSTPYTTFVSWGSIDSAGTTYCIEGSAGSYAVKGDRLLGVKPSGGSEWYLVWKNWTADGMTISNVWAGTGMPTNDVVCVFTFYR